MPTTFVTPTGNVRDLVGDPYLDTRRTKVALVANTPKIVDQPNGQVRVGSVTVNVAANGDFAFSDVIAETDAHENLQYSVQVDAPPPAGQQRRSVTFGPYEFAGISGTVNIADLEAVQSLDGFVRSEFIAEAQALLQQQADLSGIATPDAVIANRIQTPDSATATALAASDGPVATGVAVFGAPLFAPITSGVQIFMQKVATGVQDAHLLVLDDSTSAGQSSWPGRLATKLAIDWAGRGVKYRDWNPATQAWAAWTTIQNAGAGQPTIYISNGSVGGQNTTYPQRDRLAAMVGAVQPDLIVSAYLYNDDRDTEATAIGHTAQLAATLEACLLVSPKSAITLLSKPGRTDNESISYRSARMREYARSKGFGHIDLRNAFDAADPNWRSTLVGDTIGHPNTAGKTVQGDYVGRHFIHIPGAQIQPQAPSSLSGRVALIFEDDFSAWAGALPNGWTGGSDTTNALVTKDTAHKETGKHGLNIDVANTSNGAAYISRILPITAWRGKWLTVSVRVRVPSDATAPTGVGLVQLLDGVNTPYTRAFTSPAQPETDGFGWASTIIQVDPAATTLEIRLIGSILGGANDHATFDRVTLAEGLLPRDMAPAPVGGTPQRQHGVRKMISGRWYGPEVIQPGGAQNIPDGYLHLVPLWVPAGGVTVSQIAVEVEAGGSASTKPRLGIYASDADDLPSTLILDAGQTTANAGSAGIKAVTGLNLELPEGLYWLACAAQGGIIPIRTCGTISLPPVSSTDFIGSNAAGGMNAYLAGSVTGALPNPFVSAGAVTLGVMTKIKAT